MPPSNPLGSVRRYAPPARRLPRPPLTDLAGTWREAAVPRIERALAAAQRRSPGGWYVVGAATDLPATDLPARTTLVRTVAGREIVLWRGADGTLRAGPGACPHMGASLHGCPVVGDDILCRWHGLRLPGQWPGGWEALPALDDGVLLWVRADAEEAPAGAEEPLADAPAPQVRPALAEALVSVHAQAARCEPQDIIANRLDPWHGAWFHPYAFSHLVVDEAASSDDVVLTDVTFRLGRTWGVPVRASFSCPDARTIVMRIEQGEGTGSVVETHATPLGRDAHGYPRTVMTEATIATSPRWGFRLARAAAPLVRPLMARTQARLWVDDLAYAERRYLVRTGAVAS